MSDGSDPSLCPRCQSRQPPAARFCHRCGCDHAHPDDPARPASYAVHPTASVRSFDIVTSLLPLSSGANLRAYRIALAVAAAIPLISAAFGWVPFALVAAALAVPIVFTIYLYDANEWDDQPIPVVTACLVVSGLFGAAAIWLIERGLLDPAERLGLGDAGIAIRPILCFGVVAPLVAVVLGLVGPLLLAARPRFDDMIDGLTFGAVSGAAYAAGETLMTHRGVFDTSAGQRDDIATWLSIVASAAVVKPVVYGTALAIAGAAFSGVGPGHEGFRRRFLKGLGIAATAMVAYGVGVALLGEWLDAGPAAWLGLAWGAAIAAVLIVVLRTQLHLGLLEAALEAVQGKPNRHEVARDARCGRCDMYLAPLALFCNACGASVRATTKTRQRENVSRAPVSTPGSGSSGSSR